MAERVSVKTSIRNKIMVAFILAVMIWGVVTSGFLGHALNTILVREGLSEEVISKVSKDFVTISTGMTLAGICIFHLISVYFSRMLIHPLRKFSEGVQALARGRRDVQIDVSGGDELGHLAGAFNQMVEDLRNTTVSKDYINSIIESMINMVMVVSPDGTVQRVNRALLDLLGYREEDIVGKPADMVIIEKKVTATLFNDLLQYSPICNVETVYLSHSGGRIPVSFSSSAMRGSDDRVVGIVCVAQDITEQKIAEEKLQKSQQELMAKHEELKHLFIQVEKVKKEWENILDCVGDIVILTDMEGRIKRCNKALYTITGKGYSELINRSWKDVLFDQEIDINACCDMGLELFHKQTGRWFELKHYPFREFGDPQESGMVITIHDSSEVKQVTAALEKAYVDLKVSHAKILQQEKMASIGLLAAGVAHEINNPLGFIKCNLGTLDQYTVTLNDFISFQSSLLVSMRDAQANAQVARVRAEQEIDYVLKDSQELIMESLDGVERVRKIIKDLKSFSRIDEGEQISTNINECLATALNIVWNELKYKATVQKEYGRIPQTLCYPQQLQQVFMNLLLNAAHAIEKMGEIGIRTWYRDGSIFVQIADTGRGIPEDQLGRIFEPFFTTKIVGEGTGLGLSITYDIVKKHNGDISVTSDVGKGTTFTVRLPVTE